jgi:hypothetical protein
MSGREFDPFDLGRANTQYVENFGVTEAFEFYKVEDWIDSYRKTEIDGFRLDIATTAAVLGLKVDMNLEGAERGKVADDFRHILLNRTLPESTRRFAFGREVGRILFMRKELGFRGDANVEERFCRLFGMEMAMPRRQLQGLDDVNEPVVNALAERYQLNLTQTLYQLIAAEKLPLQTAVKALVPREAESEWAGSQVVRLLCYPCEFESGCSNIPIIQMGVVDMQGTPAAAYLSIPPKHRGDDDWFEPKNPYRQLALFALDDLRHNKR